MEVEGVGISLTSFIGSDVPASCIVRTLFFLSIEEMSKPVTRNIGTSFRKIYLRYEFLEIHFQVYC
jgi:hypothetical protein